MRIFIGLTEIANYYSNLKEGFEELGVKADFIQESKHPFYAVQKTTFLEKCLQGINHQRLKLSNQFRYLIILRKLLVFLTKIIKTFILIQSIFKYDVFIFGYKSSFIDFRELYLLKFFKKKIIYVFHGSDSRLPYTDGSIMSGDISDLKITECLKFTKRQKKEIKLIEKNADLIVSAYTTSHFFNRTIINFISIGLPYKISKFIDHNYGSNQNQTVTILHCPSHPEAKGTLLIEKAIDSLKQKGYLINYIRITQMPNSTVLKNLQNCDFVVDQLYSDTPMAGFAAEAAFCGKPAIVGGYYTDEDLKMSNIPPSLHCHPEKVEQAIEQLIINLEFRLELGQKAKSFVENYWAPKKVAERYLRLINENIPDEWQCNPNKINYLYGGGLPDWKTKLIIRKMIEKYGIKSLQLSDKAYLEKQFKEFAYSND